MKTKADRVVELLLAQGFDSAHIYVPAPHTGIGCTYRWIGEGWKGDKECCFFGVRRLDECIVRGIKVTENEGSVYIVDVAPEAEG